MFKVTKPLHLTSVGLVVIPIAVSCTMTGALALAMVLTGRWESASKSALMILAVLIYATVLFVLGRSGIANVRGLETRARTDPLTRLPNRQTLHEDKP